MCIESDSASTHTRKRSCTGHCYSTKTVNARRSNGRHGELPGHSSPKSSRLKSPVSPCRSPQNSATLSNSIRFYRIGYTTSTLRVKCTLTGTCVALRIKGIVASSPVGQNGFSGMRVASCRKQYVINHRGNNYFSASRRIGSCSGQSSSQEPMWQEFI